MQQVAGATPGFAPSATAEVKVWDPFVRVFHWTVAAGFFVAYVTEDLITVHVWAGYVVGALVVLRIAWGVVGPRHARFSDFLFSPFTMLRYTAALLTGSAKERYLGHSPAGAAMVFALLIGCVAIVGSGLVLYAVEDDAGPLAGIVGAGPAAGDGHGVYEDDDEGRTGEEEHERAEGAEEVWDEVHEVAANVVLVLVVVHIAGVLLASAVHHENLTRSMITGRKRPLGG